MAEYIEREAALEIINSLNIASALYAGRKIINLPPADVAQVRHGRWVKIEEHMVLTYNTYSPITITSETCSECNVRSGFIGRKGYVKDNSCPNCGAKMLEG